ncbi:MAG: 23S rRNA pseudouridine(1911/1915/1917) synthase RluD [Chromatiales bacterium]|jgi:23S rRNA pseudouridine1911/1915/1917 synthase|nr:23S rRNA pseudouridine(1911/1915/1917) synthase RluD [Chromatiales bacterium]MDP6151074.1 23S rRNA pseudouridine(1911/1915/1917) synthase RluD [Gammaproteobacteria bacterium]MDP7093915.1 23S rRNA pseudouridine(1911/1915/1917) synthase RluD [Gammaproteobacteria bacterium]MDP7269851.1 23S rRNA pseudouridine(1911/1915/1917) synthase RluD [Gammaproteobacteria bacterium]HJP03490.1 23S rRNA pseudouridine(1911/1915/1917) synthase RluD [Gammaproteobacteria bacterium]
MRHTATIDEGQDGKRFDQALAELFPDYSRSRLKGWIKAGQVLLDGEMRVPRFRVSTGQQVVLEAEAERVSDAAPEPMQLEIVFEDDDLLVINKPAGLVVHPGAGNISGTLMNGLLHHAPELEALPRAGILHRLDKDTSGLLLVARSIRAHTRLVRDLEKRRLHREYRAVCNDRLTAGGTVNAPIGRHATQRTRMAVNEKGKPAVTHYRVLERFAAYSFLAVRLETGRTHQIRVHLAWQGHPLAGDPVYGGRLKIPAGTSARLVDMLKSFGRQALHASDLGFKHPQSGVDMHFHAALPADLLELLNALAGDTRTDFEHMQWP